MLTTDQIGQLTGDDVIGAGGVKLGSIGQVYVDDQTGRPSWVTVRGLPATPESFVPLGHAELHPQGLSVPYDSDTVAGAPSLDAEGGHLSVEEEAALHQYYGLDYGGDTSGDTPGEATADEAMTVSEERLQAGTETVETRVRLRKYVVTEMQQIDVPVRREEVRLVREPISETDGGEAVTGADLVEEEHVITLHAERPVITTETVPVERVRVSTETVTDTETVTGEVRKEKIEVEDPSRPPDSE